MTDFFNIYQYGTSWINEKYSFREEIDWTQCVNADPSFEFLTKNSRCVNDIIVQGNEELRNGREHHIFVSRSDCMVYQNETKCNEQQLEKINKLNEAKGLGFLDIIVFV